MKNKKTKFTMTEVLSYLEDLISFDGADEIEEDLYYSIKWTNKYKKGYLTYVLDKMHELEKQKY